MPGKYHIKIADAPPRRAPVPRLNVIELDGCLGCLNCVKRDACLYDVHVKRSFDAAQIVDSADVDCVNCLRCVQECKKGVLTRIVNPEFDQLGDAFWTPELISRIWKQAETGRIPVSGAGYRGTFAGPGYDEMWTDMSEIVRPTRDGIHGRESISTVVELGRKPDFLRFGAAGALRTTLPAYIELPLPAVFDLPACAFLGAVGREAVVRAAGELRTLAVASLAEAQGPLSEYREHLIVELEGEIPEASELAGVRIVQLPDAARALALLPGLRAALPQLVVAARLRLDETAADTAAALVRAGIDVIRLELDRCGNGFGRYRDEFATTLVAAVHARLVEERLRERVTVLQSGGIAMAEHMAKAIICGADGVGLDQVLLLALGCRLCKDAATRGDCPAGIDELPVDWGRQRILNLMGSWHSQLLEVLGAMGLREVRRLRGERGRAMFFDELEKESMAPIFGRRVCSLAEALRAGAVQEQAPGGAADVSAFAGISVGQSAQIAPCASRFRNELGKSRVVRTSACVACGRCVEACAYGVHRRAGNRMLAPVSHLCRGLEHCRAAGACCVDVCPHGALRVGPDPAVETFGDPRWTPDLLISTWTQAETGRPPVREDLNFRTGASGGGFDRMRFCWPPSTPALNAAPVNLQIPLNRRGDDRPAVTLGLPVYGGGMSYGSISLPTMVARARAYRAFDSFTCTGEGGYPRELEPYDEHVITQVATGLFGVSEQTIKRVRVVEFKYAQGAKPGLGGHLLGDKVTPAVAAMREAVAGSSLFSPFPFHSVYSVEDHKKHVDWIKAINPRALVSVKVSTPSDVDMVAVGSYYAGAHVIHLDGSYGGTGAAPDIAKKNIAMPIEYAIPKVHRFLEAEGIRDRVTLIASGGIRTAWDAAKAIALGADGVVIGTSELVALGCVRCGVCERGRGCPRGIATTDPELEGLYDADWAAQRLVNLLHSWAVQLTYIVRRAGLSDIRDLVGRTDLLRHADYEPVALDGSRR